MRVKIQVSEVELIEAPENVLGRSVEVASTRIIREVIAQRFALQFFLETPKIAKQEDDGGLVEPARVDHRIEEEKTLCDFVLVWFSRRMFVVLADVYEKYNAGAAFELMDPLFPL